MKLNRILTLGIFGLGFISATSITVTKASAAETTLKRGTAIEAQKMLDDGILFLKEKGKDVALKEFSNPKSKFINKDLYLFAVDFNGVELANGGFPALVGKNVLDLKDAEDRFFVKNMIETAKTKNKGAVQYKWKNPKTGKVEEKETFVEKFNDFFLACGYYK